MLCALPPIMLPVTVGLVHVYVVPVGIIFPLPFVGAIVKAEPVQIVLVKSEALFTVGNGFTVITHVKLFAHPLAAAAIVYVAVLSTFVMCERV